MVRVRLTILRLRRYPSDTQFEVYADLGTGRIDEIHPLGPGCVPLWPEAARRNGHLGDGHVSLRHLDSVDPDGHLETLHVAAEHLWPAWPVVVDSPFYVFGRFDHAVKLFDGAGNASFDPPASCTVTVNAAPREPRGLKSVGYDGSADRVTFWFHGSRFDAIRGA